MDIPGIDLPGPGDIIGGVGGFFGGLAEDAGQAIVEYVIEFIFGLIAQAVASITGALAASVQRRLDPGRPDRRLVHQRRRLDGHDDDVGRSPGRSSWSSCSCRSSGRWPPGSSRRCGEPPWSMCRSRSWPRRSRSWSLRRCSRWSTRRRRRCSVATANSSPRSAESLTDVEQLRRRRAARHLVRAAVHHRSGPGVDPAPGAGGADLHRDRFRPDHLGDPCLPRHPRHRPPWRRDRGCADRVEVRDGDLVPTRRRSPGLGGRSRPARPTCRRCWSARRSC